MKNMKRFTELFLIIAQEKFYYLKFILEGYDNLCILSSFDNRRGVVKICFPIESQKQVIKLLDALAPRIRTSVSSKEHQV